MARDADRTSQRILSAEGTLPTHYYKPAELLALVQSTSTTWSSMNPEYGVDAPADRAHRRRTVTEAVRRLLAS